MTNLTNTFHVTEYRTRKSPDDLNRLRHGNPFTRDPADRRFVARVRRALCGVDGCVCARNDLGERS